MTIRLPYPLLTGADVPDGSYPALAVEVQENLDRLATQAGTQTPLTRGNGTVAWTAAQASAVVTVTHGLNGTPVALLVTFDTIGSGQFAFPVVGNRTSTTFQVQGWSPVAFTGTLGFSWQAEL